MTNTQTLSVRLDVPFTDKDIDLNIMGSGFTVYEWWTHMTTKDDGYYIGAENPTEGGTLFRKVPCDDIRRVMGNICADAYPNANSYALAKQQIMDGIRTGDFDIDADGADEIMQIAVFGEVVYS